MSTNVQNISNGMQDIVKILNNYSDVFKTNDFKLSK